MPVERMRSITAGGAENPLHAARSFRCPPDRDRAVSLLAELATARCAFSPPSPDGPLALYGAGNLGRLARDHLRAVGRSFALVIDRNARALALDHEWAGALLMHPDQVTQKLKAELRLAVSVATAPYVPLERSLAALGFRHIVPFYDWAENFRHRHPLSNGWFADPLTAQDRDKTAEVLARWDDDVSRAHHLQFLAWRRLREEWTFDGAPVEGGNRFFIPEVAAALRSDEVLLDAGAHHGSVTREFVQRTKGAFRQIVAVEPDPTNRATLADELRLLLPGDPRVTLLDCPLAEHAGTATFHDGLGYASQLSDTGLMRVATRAIDTLGIKPTFVKLHLEGHELAALKGARQTLLSCRPIVAVTVYHNADGIWRTPLWLMQTLPGYRFLLRLDSWCGTGAVLYAIPDERSRA
jgi:FkbM family methyltransferase